MKPPTRSVKVGQVITVLEKLGFATDDQVGRVRLFSNAEGDMLTLPADPEQELFPKHFGYLLRDMRLRERQFWELLDEPSKKAS